MSKGSGRRRISPSDGLMYDEETMMTNIEQRGASHYQSGSKEMRLGLRTGAAPTTGYYGRGRRYAGKGRKDDNRNWKSHHKGKQYEHNAQMREAQEHHRDVPESVANRMREKSINSDLSHNGPCKIWSQGRLLRVADITPARDKFMDKFAKISFRDIKQGTIERNAEEDRRASYISRYGTYKPFRNSPRSEQTYRIGFAKFEEKVRNILDNISYGLIDAFGSRTY